MIRITFLVLLCSIGSPSYAAIQYLYGLVEGEQRTGSANNRSSINGFADIQNTNIFSGIYAAFGYDFSCSTIQSGVAKWETPVVWPYNTDLTIDETNPNQEILGFAQWSGTSASCLVNGKFVAKSGTSGSISGKGFSISLPNSETGGQDNDTFNVTKNAPPPPPPNCRPQPPCDGCQIP